MKKTIFVGFILLLNFLPRVNAQIILTVDKEPCAQCDILVQNWGVYKTDEIGKVYLSDLINARMSSEIDTILAMKNVTLAVPSKSTSLPTVIRTVPWAKLSTGYAIDITTVDIDSEVFGTRLITGDVEESCSIFVENSPQRIHAKGMYNEYIRYPKQTQVLRLLFWNGVNDFEIVEVRSPKYRSPKQGGAQTFKIDEPELHRNVNLTKYDVVLENPTIDLYDQIGIRTLYQVDEAGRYWYSITVIDSLAQKLYYAGINLQSKIPVSLQLQTEPLLGGALTTIDPKKIPLDVPRINLQVDLHYIVEKNTELPREVFDNTKTSKEHSKLTLLAKVGIGIGGILLIGIGYFLYFRRGGSDFV